MSATEDDVIASNVALLMSASISMRRRLELLESRLQTVEHTTQRLTEANQRLSAHNAAKAAQGARVREAIRRAMGDSPQPFRLTSKVVWRRLDLVALGCPNLSLRTIREHMRNVRGSTRVPPTE